MRLLDRTVHFCLRLPHQLLIWSGLLLLAGTVITTAVVPGRNLAVSIAIVGTFFGTVLLSLSLSKVIRSLAAQETRRTESQSALKGRLKQSERRRDAAEAELSNAAEEIARLERMQVNVTAFQPILKLGLLEVETSITDFQRRVITGERDQGWFRNGSRKVYQGALQIPVKAHLGVDLQKVRVREEEGNQLVLSGLTMISMTDTAEGARWLLDEIRTEYVKDEQIVQFKSDTRDPRSKDFSRDQELQVRARLKEGQDFKVFESGLVRTAEQLLRVLLAPLEKELVFETEPTADSMELFAYLDVHNRELQAAIAELRNHLSAPRQLPEKSSVPEEPEI
jgi:hypothetical protein